MVCGVIMTKERGRVIPRDGEVGCVLFYTVQVVWSPQNTCREGYNTHVGTDW